jgi:hypothetical protein
MRERRHRNPPYFASISPINSTVFSIGRSLKVEIGFFAFAMTLDDFLKVRISVSIVAPHVRGKQWDNIFSVTKPVLKALPQEVLVTTR